MPVLTAAPVVESLLRTYRGTWKASAFSQFLAPLLFLASLGFGLGSLVDDGPAGRVDGVGYAAFVAPGLVMVNAMYTAVGESTYTVLGAVTWQRTYYAMIATPMRVVDVVVGHLVYVAFRLALGASAFAVAALVLGAVTSPWLAAVVPLAVLCGLAHAAPIMAYAVGQENDQGFTVIFRLIAVPMFLFAGTFFPVDQLPAALRPIAWLTPLWHGTDLVRSLVLGRASLLPALGHLVYLLVWVVAAVVVARRCYERRLCT